MISRILVNHQTADWPDSSLRSVGRKITSTDLMPSSVLALDTKHCFAA